MSSVDGGAGNDDERVIDLDRVPRPGDPPVPGAQWDEVHGRWERWDEQAGSWEVLGDPAASQRSVAHGLRPEAPPSDLRQHLASDLGADADTEHIIDIDRIARPEQPVPGAQWNEVVGRWEVWSEAADTWVEARS